MHFYCFHLLTHGTPEKNMITNVTCLLSRATCSSSACRVCVTLVSNSSFCFSSCRILPSHKWLAVSSSRSLRVFSSSWRIQNMGALVTTNIKWNVWGITSGRNWDLEFLHMVVFEQLIIVWGYQCSTVIRKVWLFVISHWRKTSLNTLITWELVIRTTIG